ncbi:hypothetical protein [Nostoc sp.]
MVYPICSSKISIHRQVKKQESFNGLLLLLFARRLNRRSLGV